MIGTLETHSSTVKLADIAIDDARFDVRLRNADRESTLLAEIEMLGLLHPVTLEKTETEKFLILDGYRRVRALSQAKAAEAGDDVPAVVVSEAQLTDQDRMTILKNKNGEGDTRYGLFERGLLVKTFIKRGLGYEDLAPLVSGEMADVDHYLTIARAPASLGAALNAAPLKPQRAADLIDRFENWLNSPYGTWAEPSVKKIIQHLDSEEISELSWKFLLDFYWPDGRPFMAPRNLS